MEIGHWQYEFEFDVNDFFGFIYLISNPSTRKEYIGKKQFFTRRRVKVKGRKNRRVVIKESNWKVYTGSSKHLNLDIDTFGKDNFVFEIIELCETKACLSYREAEIQWKENVLSEKMDNGEWKYYNRSINAVRFRLDSHSDETRKKISESHKGKKLSEKHKESLRGKTPHNKGIPMTEEAKENLRQVNLGKKASDETKKKMSNTRKGMKHSEESKKKMSEITPKVPVIMYTNNMEVVCEYKSIKDASISTGIPSSNICHCCKGRLPSAGGYVWKYL